MRLPRWLQRRITVRHERLLAQERALHHSQYASVRRRAETAEGQVAQLRAALATCRKSLATARALEAAAKRAAGDHAATVARVRRAVAEMMLHIDADPARVLELLVRLAQAVGEPAQISVGSCVVCGEQMPVADGYIVDHPGKGLESCVGSKLTPAEPGMVDMDATVARLLGEEGQC